MLVYFIILIQMGLSLCACKRKKNILITRFFMKTFALIAVSLLAAISAFADTKVVEGSMRFRFRVESSSSELLDSFFEYRNNSNSQQVIERGRNYIVVENTVDLSPLRTRVPFPADDRYGGGEYREYLDYSTSRKGIEITRGGGELIRREFIQKTPLSDAEIELLRRKAGEITSGARYQHEAVEQVMQYIRSTVSYSLQSSSNPADVLRTGKAYCEGYANVAALMLRTIGIPAKVVDSYIPPGHMWGYGQEGSGGYHAHVEVFYQDTGWISYDPQATVHFVDPFHIVNYPRERTRLIQLEEEDGREITDIIAEPVNWNNFFQRDTTEGRNVPVLVGKIIRSDGSLVKDSFRSNEWVYLRKPDGSGEGVRILSNGEFAISPILAPEDGSGPTFFYRDGMGGWIEEKVSFPSMERIERTYRLDDPSAAVRMNTVTAGSGIGSAGSGAIYLWYKTDSGVWRLDQLETGRDRTLRLVSSTGTWIVSASRMDVAPKYLLDAGQLEKGRTYALEELPLYLDPDTYYLRITLSDRSETAAVSGRGPGGMTVQFLDIDTARRYSPVEVNDDSQVIAVPDPDFSTVIVQEEGVLYVKNLTGIPQKGTAVPFNLNASSRGIEIMGARPGERIVLALRQGNRFAEIVRGAAGTDGNLRLVLDTDFIGDTEREYYLLYGSPIGSKRKAIADIAGNRLELD